TANLLVGNDSLSKLYGAIVGTELELILDKQFKVVEVRGAAALKEKIVASDPALAQVYKQVIHDQSFKHMSTFFHAVPANPVKKGDRWNDEIQLELGAFGTFKQLNRYIYQGMVGNLHLIKNEPALTSVAGKPNAPDAGLPFNIKNFTLKTSD